MEYEQLKLDNQLCFTLYAASRLITREYQPLLDKLGLTYPQYLVLMILWEVETSTVNEIAQKLILNTNTITPLLKRMEKQGIIIRARANDDERKVNVSLTDKGKNLQSAAAPIPLQLSKGIVNETISIDDLLKLKEQLYTIINYLSDKKLPETSIEL